MAFRPSKIKKHRRSKKDIHLSLTSMMDVFIVILLFLLKSYATTEQIVVSSDSFRLPVSESQLEPHSALIIKVNKEVLVLEDQKVADTPSLLKDRTLLIEPLYRGLLQFSKKTKFISSQNKTVKFRGEITIQGDRDIPFLLLKKIMYTCSQAEYGNIALAVLQKQS